ncbi:MAG: hypothetical protein PHQ42_04160 [Patescibacteria group bacterium]|nr:hypothetical protein [Patescibacteria group bacterium]
MSRIRKVFTISVMLVTVLSMSVVVAPEASAAASAGSLIKMDGLSSVYYLGADGKRYVFPNEQTYFSWYSDFSSVVTIPQSELESYPLGANVTIRPGTKLVKITTDPKVYAVEPSGTLKWVPDEATAAALYGAEWAKRVVDVSDAFFTNYTVSATNVSSTAYPTGSLVKFGTEADVYYINADGTASKVATEAAFTANRFKWSDVITSTLTLPTLGTEIAAADSDLVDTSEGGGAGVGITPGAGTGLTVALASDNPASVTTLTETGADGAQAMIPVLKANFTAAADGAVKVTTLKFKRAGVPSADTDFAEFYLYDGDTLLAKYSSISEGVLTFTSSAGLFTVSAGTTKAITLKVNLDKDSAASRAYNFSVLAATDVTTDGAAVSGSFPMTGNTMSTATVTDLGKITIATSGTMSNPDPGTTGQEIWKFTATSADQNISIERLKFTIIGTVGVTDLANFKLDVGGVQIGSTVAAMASDKTITFDFDTPYQISKGLQKTISLKADIVSGTSRTYRLYFYNKEDIMAKDLGYGVYLTPNQADTFTKVSYGSDLTINTGSLTVSKNINSPSGNVAKDAIGVEIAKFDFTAVGEDIKVDSLWPYVDTQTTDDGLYQLKFYVDGSQIGTTIDLAENDDTEVACGNAFIISAGTTKTLVVKATMKDSSNTDLFDTETITFKLGSTTGTTPQSKSVDYTRQLTGTTDTSGVISANVLTVRTGVLTSAENTSFGDRSSSNPNGVIGAAGVKIASVTLTAGAGEAVTVTQVSFVDYSTTTLMGENFQNLKIKNSSGTQLGSTIGNLTQSGASAVGTYNFSPSPAINIAAGGQYVVDVYADIKSGASDQAQDIFGLKFASVSATGDVTSADASENPADYELQTMYIAAAGNLNISDDADMPVAQQLVMGATDQEVARFKLEASASEDINITQMTISNSVSSAATGTLKNIKIYDAADPSTSIGGPVQLDTTNATTTYAHATFGGINITVPAGGSKTIIVKADVATAGDGASSASTHQFGMLIENGITATETIVAKGVQSGVVLTTSGNTIDYYATSDSTTDVDQTCNTMTVYRTKISAAWAGDTPSGSTVGSSAQTIAKINLTNSANAGNYTAIVKYVNLALSTTISNTANRTLTIYKDSTSTTNLGTTNWLATGDQNFGDTDITDAGMTDVEIASGATKLFIFTLDTTDGNVTGDFALSVNMAAGDVVWYDGVSTVTTVNSLPLIPKTLTY